MAARRASDHLPVVSSPARIQSARQRALDAALAVLHDEGVAAVTMRAVAARAGVTATALYRHFADKDQLLRDMVREVAALFRDYLASVEGREQPVERLLAGLVAARGFALDHPHYYELLFLTPLGPARRYPDGFRAKGGDFGLLAGMARACMEAGLFKSDDEVDVALTLASHLHGLLRLWRLERFGADRRRFEAFFDESFVRLFAGLATADPPA